MIRRVTFLDKPLMGDLPNVVDAPLNGTRAVGGSTCRLNELVLIGIAGFRLAFTRAAALQLAAGAILGATYDRG